PGAERPSARLARLVPAGAVARRQAPVPDGHLRGVERQLQTLLVEDRRVLGPPPLAHDRAQEQERNRGEDEAELDRQRAVGRPAPAQRAHPPPSTPSPP